MISRIWHGWTTVENADAYQRIVSTEVLPGIAARQIPGFRGYHLLRRPLGDEIEFMTSRDSGGGDLSTPIQPRRAAATFPSRRG